MDETLGQQLIREQREADEATANYNVGQDEVRRARNTTETAKAITASLAVAAGVALVAGEVSPATPVHRAPIEKSGGHQGFMPSSEPGNGMFHANGRNLHISTTPNHGIGTAVAAEKQGDHFVEVNPITFAKK